MTNEQLVNWCSTRFKNYYRIAAILSLFSPDENELNEWEITEVDERLFYVNDCAYEILTKYEANAELQMMQEGVQENLISSELNAYMDWKSYWIDHPLTIPEDLDLPFKIVFEGVIYYYNERI